MVLTVLRILKIQIFKIASYENLFKKPCIYIDIRKPFFYSKRILDLIKEYSVLQALDQRNCCSPLGAIIIIIISPQPADTL